MRRRLTGFFLLLALLTIGIFNTGHAQFGIGAGLAVSGEDIYKASGDLEAALREGGSSFSYSDLDGNLGIYGKLGYKYGLGMFRVTLDGSFIYFPTTELKLTQVDVQNDTTITATVDVGTSLIPITAGIELVAPLSFIHPYVGAYPTYTFIRRTYTYLEGAQITGVGSESAGENEFGLAIGAGVDFSLANTITLEVGARYTLANLFTSDDNEVNLENFQFGLALWFGDIVGGDDDDE